jgi:hypothetical protein
MRPDITLDGVAKPRQLLRCCDCLAASTYASTPHGSTIARLAFGAFYLAIPFDVFCESITLDRLSYGRRGIPGFTLFQLIQPLDNIMSA